MGNLLVVDLGIFGAILVVNLEFEVILGERFGIAGVTLVMETFRVDLGTFVANYLVWATGAIGTEFDQLLLS